MAQGNGVAQPDGQASRGRMSQIAGDIASFFRSPQDLSPLPGQQQQGQQNQQQNNQQQSGQQQQQGNQPSGASSAGATNDPNTMQNPLDVYKGLWSDAAPIGPDGKPVPVKEAPVFKLDSKTVGDAAGKIDFMSGLPEDVTAKLQAGTIDSDVLSAVVNHVGRNAYSRAMEHSSTLTDRFVNMRLTHEQQGLPGHVNKLLAKSKVLANPAIQANPILREQYEQITERLAGKFPDQSADWVADMANKYFADMVKAMGGQEQSQPIADGNAPDGSTVKDGKTFDWQAYLK